MINMMLKFSEKVLSMISQESDLTDTLINKTAMIYLMNTSSKIILSTTFVICPTVIPWSMKVHYSVPPSVEFTNPNYLLCQRSRSVYQQPCKSSTLAALRQSATRSKLSPSMANQQLDK